MRVYSALNRFRTGSQATFRFSPHLKGSHPWNPTTSQSRIDLRLRPWKSGSPPMATLANWGTKGSPETRAMAYMATKATPATRAGINLPSRNSRSCADAVVVHLETGSRGPVAVFLEPLLRKGTVTNVRRRCSPGERLPRLRTVGGGGDPGQRDAFILDMDLAV